VSVRQLRPFGARAHRRAFGASKKGALRGRSDGGEIALYRLRPEQRKEPQATKAREMPHRRSAINPAHPYGVPRRFAVPSAGFDSAALCGLLKLSGRRASRQVSTACGASNKGLTQQHKPDAHQHA